MNNQQLNFDNMNMNFDNMTMDFSNNQPNNTNLDLSINEPNNWSGGDIIIKFFIGLIIGGLISVLLFFSLTFFGTIFSNFETNKFLVISILIFMSFVVSFIGNLLYISIFKAFLSKKYSDSHKVYGNFLLINIFLFLAFLPIFFVNTSSIKFTFLVMFFFITLSNLSSNFILDSSKNIHYSLSTFVGNILAGVAVTFIYIFVINIFSNGNLNQQMIFFIILPPLLSFSITPLASNIWDKIYYLFYSWGKNPFFIDTANSAKDSATKGVEEDNSINVDLN